MIFAKKKSKVTFFFIVFNMDIKIKIEIQGDHFNLDYFKCK